MCEWARPLLASAHPTARAVRYAAAPRGDADEHDITKSRDALDRRTAQEIGRFLRARQVTLAGLIRRGLGERQDHSGRGQRSGGLGQPHPGRRGAGRPGRSGEPGADPGQRGARAPARPPVRDCAGTAASFIGLARLRTLPFAQRCRPCQERHGADPVCRGSALARRGRPPPSPSDGPVTRPTRAGHGSSCCWPLVSSCRRRPDSKRAGSRPGLPGGRRLPGFGARRAFPPAGSPGTTPPG